MGETGKGSQQLKSADEAAAAEGKAMVGAEAKYAGAPMACYSMEWTVKTSIGVYTQER